MGKTILILGGLGYLGSRIALSIKSPLHQVVIGASRKNSAVLPFELNDYEIRRYDLSSIQSCIELLKGIDIVIHTSGLNSEECLKSPKNALIVNGLYTANILEAINHSNVKKFIYFSTAHVYSSNLIGDVNEKTCTTNLHPYATSHLIAENQILWFGKNNETEMIIFRLSNCFGVESVENSNCWNLFVNDICKQAVFNKVINVKSNPNIQRNFLPILELCKIVEFFIQNNGYKNEIINVGSNISKTLEEVVILVKSRVDNLLNFIPIVKYNSPKLLQVKPLNYSIKKLLDFGYFYQDQIETEIDNLIIYLSKRKNG